MLLWLLGRTGTLAEECAARLSLEAVRLSGCPSLGCSASSVVGHVGCDVNCESLRGVREGAKAQVRGCWQQSLCKDTIQETTLLPALTVDIMRKRTDGGCDAKAHKVGKRNTSDGWPFFEAHNCQQPHHYQTLQLPSACGTTAPAPMPALGIHWEQRWWQDVSGPRCGGAAPTPALTH